MTVETVEENLSSATPIPNSEVSVEEELEEDFTDFTDPPESLLPVTVSNNPTENIESLPAKDSNRLKELTVLELRELCREKGLPQAGSKEELIHKITWGK